MKTVKRKAGVGELILITKADDSRYTNGDTAVVNSFDIDSIFVDINGHRTTCIFDREYEVITEEANEMGVIEKMQAEIAELKSKVVTLEGKKSWMQLTNEVHEAVMKGPSIAESLIPKSPQQTRDEIVSKAKADVAELKSIYLKYTCRAEFIVNKEKRTIVVLLRGIYSNDIQSKGIAKADPSDCFNVHIGKAIALRRALGLEVPAEYYNAPAPTEVRLGDFMTPTDAIHPQRHKVVESLKIDMRRGVITLEDARYYVGKCLGKIIDDSREEE
ncbi:hypothetical protein [Peribacillus frigoritolerans]|uniref:hypothetical protein n=1 Tax=Peribacillus frigoritolerans TaxID=450367 RepID=UPI002E1A3DC3|nr:hypothetical protein [Peribacillus frigoritolerans]MED3845582.1 hypothetical protein [Peribacillus frigoritolerans]